jgi:defect-in-organelle-trafficking protein DotC
MNLLKNFTILPLLILLVSGCAYQSSAKNKTEVVLPYSQMGYVKIKLPPKGTQPINPIRLQALRDTATSLGAQGALAWGSEHINDSLSRQSRYLDQVFDFSPLILDHNVLPPILVESSSELNLDGPDTIRQASKSYKIIKPARFVTVPPTWRDYLFLDYKRPHLPNRSLLPQNPSESQAWNFYLKRSWNAGTQQAYAIFNANLNRLKRDYLGIILYRELVAKNMITIPVVSKADLGITGDENYVRIQDEVLRITAQSALNLQSNEWKPVFTSHLNSARTNRSH